MCKCIYGPADARLPWSYHAPWVHDNLNDHIKDIMQSQLLYDIRDISVPFSCRLAALVNKPATSAFNTNSTSGPADVMGSPKLVSC